MQMWTKKQNENCGRNPPTIPTIPVIKLNKIIFSYNYLDKIFRSIHQPGRDMSAVLGTLNGENRGSF